MDPDRVNRAKGSRLPERPKNLLRSLNRYVRKVAWRRYATAKAYYLARLRLTPTHDPLLVYTVGKVGSTSVAKSLQASGVDRAIHHLHWLTPEQLARGDAFYRAADRKYRGTVRARRFRPEFLWLGQHLSRQIKRHPEKRWQVITLVRDPVARNVSAFFQNLDSFFDYWIDEELPKKGVEQVAQELVTLFTNSYVHAKVPTGVDFDPLQWLDKEFKPVFGVDVYSGPFPVAEGFKVYEAPQAHVLLLRLEDLDACSEEALQMFLGLDNYLPGRSNVGESKPYAMVYQRFLELVQLPDEYLDRLYGSKYSMHFYSAEELARFRTKWQADRP